MTAEDLVGTESDNPSDISSVSVPLSSNVSLPANANGAKTTVATPAFDVRQLAFAISSAKSKFEVERIVREYSWQPSKVSCTSEPGSMSDSREGSGSVGGGARELLVAETGRSTPLDSSGSVVGNATLTASTKSYSWSSSLPNGSTLETLASNGQQRKSDSTTSLSAAEAGAVKVTVAPKTVAEGQSTESSSVSENGDTTASQIPPTSSAASEDLDVSLVASGGGADNRNPTVVSDGVGVVQQVADSTERHSSRSLRVGDFLPSRGDVFETTFGSPRVSLIERLSRPRHYDDSTFSRSQFDQSVAVTMSASSRLMSTPAASTSSGISGPRVQFSSQSGNNPPADDCTGSQRPMSNSPRGSSRRLDSTVNFMSSMVDSMASLTMGPLADTVLTASSLSMLPIDSQNITTASVAVVDRDVGVGRDAIGFSGKIPSFARPRSPASRTANMSPVRALTTFTSGTFSFVYFTAYCEPLLVTSLTHVSSPVSNIGL